MLNLARRASSMTPLPWLLGNFSRGVRVVIYHHLAEPCVFTRPLRISTPPERFESHIKRFSRDYDLVSLDDVLEGALPKRPLLVTFDDAYRSVLEVGAPVLRAYGVRPLFFITTSPVFEGEILLDNLLSYAETTAPDALAAVCGVPAGATAQTVLYQVLPGRSAGERAELRDRLAARLGGTSRELARQTGLYLGPPDLAALAAAGFSFGSHTRTHIHTRGIRREELEAEILEPLRQITEATGRAACTFSFPFGGAPPDVAPTVLEALGSANVARYFVVGRRRNRCSAGPRLFRSDVGELAAGLLTSEIEVVPALRTMYRKLWRRAEE